MGKMLGGVCLLVFFFISLSLSLNVDIVAYNTEIGLGQSIKVYVTISNTTNVENVVVWPFVNGLQWGSSPQTNSSGIASIILPFPNPGTVEVLVAVLQSAAPMFTVGLPISAFGEGISLSNSLSVTVADREILRPNPARGFYVSMEWEPWFTPLNDRWAITEAIPIVGRYDSYNVDVIKQHSIWMSEAGVDSLMVDWTNNLWQKNHWDERDPDIQELCNATTVTLEMYTYLLSSTQIPAPKIILLLGLDNGIQSTTTAVSEELDFVWESYITNSSISKDLWVIYEGKPLIIFDGGNEHDTLKPPLNDSRFTIRWMSSQFQATGYNKLGFWSWMDGSLAPIPTIYNSTVEALTVTPAFFAGNGWLGADAYARLGGTTFVEQFKTAYTYPPTFLIINQWNEFEGQANGYGYGPNHDIYADTYSLTLSDDIEPTDVSICAYPRPNQKCGGWGFFYLNLLRALVNMHEMGKYYNFTILTVGSPEPGDIVNQTSMQITWNTIGLPPKQYQVSIGSTTTYYPANVTTAELDLTLFKNGLATITVTALGASTPYLLSYDEVDVALSPLVVPSITVDFWIDINSR